MAPASTPLRNETGLIRRLPVLGYRYPSRPLNGREAQNGRSTRRVGARRPAAASASPPGRIGWRCTARTRADARRGTSARPRRPGPGGPPTGPSPRRSRSLPPSTGPPRWHRVVNEVAVEPLAVEPAVRASVAAASGPAAADGIVGLVVELIERGAEVELERGGWRLRVHRADTRCARGCGGDLKRPAAS